jgi:hypothetical protein
MDVSRHRLDLVILLVAGAIGPSCRVDQAGDADATAEASVDADADIDGDAPEVVPEPSTWVWDVYGSTGRQYANAVAESEDHGVYLAGGVPEAFVPDLPGGWLARLDSEGRARWEVLLGSWLSAVAPHPEGGVVVVGSAADERGFGLVARVDADGSPAWRLEWDIGPGLEWPLSIHAIQETPDGTFVFAGSFPRWYPEGETRAWIAEMTAEGELLWQRTLEELQPYRAALAMAGDSGILLAASGPDGEAWLTRLDRHGVPTWTRYMEVGRTMLTTRVDVAETSDSDIVLVSTYLGAALVTRFGAAGDLRWQRTIGSEAGQYGTVVLAGADGSVVVGGTSFPADDGGPDLWVVGVDRGGEPTWQQSLSWEGCEVAHGAVTGHDGSVIFATGGCLHTLVVKLDFDGSFFGECELFEPTDAPSSRPDVIVEEIALTWAETGLAPTMASLDTVPTTSPLDVLCQSPAARE